MSARSFSLGVKFHADALAESRRKAKACWNTVKEPRPASLWGISSARMLETYPARPSSFHG
jgi:hypothetical protein